MNDAQSISVLAPASALLRAFALGWGIWPSPDDFDGDSGTRGRDLYVRYEELNHRAMTCEDDAESKTGLCDAEGHRCGVCGWHYADDDGGCACDYYEVPGDDEADEQCTDD